MQGLGPLLGYAVGTAQVLFLDWWRKLATHRRHIRLLRAELRRLSTYKARFGWTPEGPQTDEEVMPRPPKASDIFMRTIGETDFTLTDENADDNSQQSLLHIVDGCTVLEKYVGDVLALLESAHGGSQEVKERFVNDTPKLAIEYDTRADELMFLIDGAIADMDRRLLEARLLAQLKRIGRPLPTDSNPAPLVANDPRVEEWKRKQLPPAM